MKTTSTNSLDFWVLSAHLQGVFFRCLVASSFLFFLGGGRGDFGMSYLDFLLCFVPSFGLCSFVWGDLRGVFFCVLGGIRVLSDIFLWVSLFLWVLWLWIKKIRDHRFWVIFPFTNRFFGYLFDPLPSGFFWAMYLRFVSSSCFFGTEVCEVVLEMGWLTVGRVRSLT